MIKVLKAQRINRLMGGVMVAPWEIDQLPDEEIDAVLTLERVGELKDGFAKVEDAFAYWREEYDRKQS